MIAQPQHAEIEQAGCLGTESVPSQGQFNLFTGELEPLPRGAAALPEEAWLFDPDFGLVLPNDPAGKNQVSGGRCQVTGYREQGIEGGVS